MSVIAGSEKIPRIVYVVGNGNKDLAADIKRRLHGGYKIKAVSDTNPPFPSSGTPILVMLTDTVDSMYTAKGIPIVYYGCEVCEPNSDAEQDSGSEAGSDVSGHESGAEDSGNESGAEDSGPEDEQKREKTDDITQIAKEISNEIRDLHIAADMDDLIHKIHVAGDIMVAKAYTRGMFRVSKQMKDEKHRKQCIQGIDSTVLDLQFLEIARNMPPIT